MLIHTQRCFSDQKALNFELSKREARLPVSVRCFNSITQNSCEDKTNRWPTPDTFCHFLHFWKVLNWLCSWLIWQAFYVALAALIQMWTYKNSKHLWWAPCKSSKNNPKIVLLSLRGHRAIAHVTLQFARRYPSTALNEHSTPLFATVAQLCPMLFQISWRKWKGRINFCKSATGESSRSLNARH